jgi:DHA2 family multidrug resistance protein
MFLPLSLATLGSLPMSAVPAGTGFYNLTRQLGGSIGVAVLTTVVAHREAIHRAVLVQHIAAGHAPALGRLGGLAAAFARHSADPVAVRHQAFAALDQLINGQSMLLSFADAFSYVAIAFIATLPLVFFLGRGRGGLGAAAH